MPLLEVIQTRHISALIRLDEVTAIQVDQYAAFIHAAADDVVGKALNYFFSKDRDFQEFLKTPQPTQMTRSLRIRKVSTVDGGGMINPEILWQSHNGAAHRKNIDTPPLVGSCLAPCGS